MSATAAEACLRWIAELGSGSIKDLRSKLDGVGRAHSTAYAVQESGRWLRDLSSLGHVELDWEGGTWAASPLVVTRLPGTDGLALLTGPRTSEVDEALHDLDVIPHAVQQLHLAGTLDRPASIVLQYDSVDALKSASGLLGARYIPCAAVQLARLLPPIALGAPAAPPADGDRSLERFSTLSLAWTHPSADDRRTPGLYRVQRHGRLQHLYRDQHQWLHCDMASGVHTALAQSRTSVLRWRAAAGDAAVGDLCTDWGAPLPALHQRALVLCSGLVPRFSQLAQTAVYVNVPRAVALQVATSLGQALASA